jgi:hypothetical protein
MRNIILKITLTLLIFGCISSLSYAIDNEPSIRVKLNGAANSTYTGGLQNISNADTLLNFKIVGYFTSSTNKSYSITFPSGFQYVSHSEGWTPCNNQTITLAGGIGFAYNLSPTNTNCVSEIILTYKVSGNTLAQNHQIGIFDTMTNQAGNSLNLWTISTNSLQTAETVDSDGNGYVDRYKLTFAASWLTNFSNNGLTIWTLGNIALISATNNIAYISFDNSTYKTWDKPDIIDGNGLMFTWIWVIETGTVTEQDKAWPRVLSVNGNAVNGANNPTINISQNGRLEIKMSEKILSSTINAGFIIKENGTNITNTSYITTNGNNEDTIYYCKWWYNGNNCNTNFDSSKTYTVELANTITDLNSIANTANILTITFGDTSSPTWSSITHNSETNAGIVIQWNAWNNNYTNTSNGSVSLSISWTDNSGTISKMCISETSMTNNASCNNWENYSTTKSHTFSSEWAKTIYIKFKDATWNISAVYSDTITWDKTKPTSSSAPSSGSFANGSTTITLSCSDSLSWCDKIYYTTDGTTPTTSSSSVSSWSGVSISGTNQTKTFKFFSKDLAWNLESPIQSKSYVFSNSYATFTNPVSITTTTGLTLTWTCNNASGDNTVEYSLNSGTYTWATSDACQASNTWSTNITLNSNTTNTIALRLKNNTNIKQTINIIHDNTAPTWSISINGWTTSTTSTSVSLTISANDAVWISNMCISETSLTNNNNCSSWEAYNTTKAFTVSSGLWTKTVYIKFKDTAGNIGAVYSDTITLESTTQTSTPISSGGGGWSSWWSSGGGWWSSSSIKNYESFKKLTKVKQKLISEINKNVKIKAILDVSKLPNQLLTWDKWVITLKWHLKSKSNLIIYPNTKILQKVSYIQPPHSIEIIRDLKKKTIKISGSEFKGYNVKKLFYVWEKGTSVSFNKNVWLEFNLWEKTKEKVYVYFSKTTNGNFTLLKWNLEVDKNGIVKLETNTLWYFALIKARYLWKKAKQSSGTNVDFNTKKTVENIQNKLANDVKNIKLRKYIILMWDSLIDTRLDYYLSFNEELRNRYLKSINGYNNYIRNIDKYYTSKDKKYLTLAKEAYNEYKDFKNIKNYDFQWLYINKKQEGDITIYKTKYTPYIEKINKVEKIVLAKFKKLLDQKKIGEQTYLDAIDNYNQFILQLTIYKQTKYKKAVEQALIPGRKFIKIYRMK